MGGKNNEWIKILFVLIWLPIILFLITKKLVLYLNEISVLNIISDEHFITNRTDFTVKLYHQRKL